MDVARRMFDKQQVDFIQLRRRHLRRARDRRAVERSWAKMHGPVGDG
jgi:hypothetical protein